MKNSGMVENEKCEKGEMWKMRKVEKKKSRKE